MSRSFGATPLTTRPPIAMVPELISSSPAIILRSVLLPQPEGPTSTQNSPSSTSTSTPCRTSLEPKLLRTPLRVTEVTLFSVCRGSCLSRKIAGGRGRLAARAGAVKWRGRRWTSGAALCKLRQAELRRTSRQPKCRTAFQSIAGAKVNVVGTVNVFEAARRLGIRRLAYASSIAAYGAMDEGHGAMHTLYGAYK